MTSGGGSDANIVAERRARSARKGDEGVRIRAFESRGNIRRLYGTVLDQELVYGKLLSAGYELERTIHKQGTNQSHGRWEVRSAAARFEVHLGYKDNKSPPNPLVDTIVQGLKRW